MESTDDRAALRRLDPQAVAAIYDRYFPEVYRYARYRLGDETLAEDIASEVFVRLLEAVRARRGPETNLHGWLLATANHMVTDQIRKHYRRPLEPLDETLPAGLPVPADQVEAGDDRHHLQSAMAQLTDEQQHVLAMRFGEGYTLEETAAVMKKNVNAVKQLQLRALASLRRKIGGTQ